MQVTRHVRNENMTDDDRTTVLDTPEQIKAFRLFAIQKGIMLYNKHKIKVARNFPTVKQLRSWYPEIFGQCRTYVQAEAAINEYLKENYGPIVRRGVG